jgi:hypothetical protein
MQCDFLQLQVLPPRAPPLVDPSERFPAGALRALPAASFDVVVMSLVLSYLPGPAQRARMVAKARRLLPPAVDSPTLAAPVAATPADELSGCGCGMLLLIDTFAVDRHSMAWHGMAWHGMAWHGMAWHGMAWHS